MKSIWAFSYIFGQDDVRRAMLGGSVKNIRNIVNKAQNIMKQNPYICNEDVYLFGVNKFHFITCDQPDRVTLISSRTDSFTFMQIFKECKTNNLKCIGIDVKTGLLVLQSQPILY